MIEAPGWFRSALDSPGTSGVVEVDGARIAFRMWGERGEQDVVLVHGGAAHSGWWDFLAPLLATGRRVVALDLSGHGDSDHREHYSTAHWSDEIEAVARAADLGPHPVLVGHSLGGLIGLELARRRTLPFSGVIVVDSPIGSSPEHTRATEEIAVGEHRVYPTLEDAVARFRPVPAQDVLPYIHRHVAERSLRAVPGGYSWKFDVHLFPTEANTPATLDGLPCPVVLLAAEHGIVRADLRRSRTDAHSRTAVIEIPDAGHAPMVDQPLALLAALRGVLAGWATSVSPPLVE